MKPKESVTPLNKEVLGSQPPLLSGSDYVKLDLVKIKGDTPASAS